MFNKENLKAYRIVEHHYSEDLKSEAYLMEHIKSGARIALLDNDEENKVFYIGFRTPPKDSTGVAHILEHSVLCGSEAFPVKDPFVELAKGSLNTFLNAMTYPDKTVYPVASCNDQDFKNLMHVYMDAVLHPNIYSEEKIFRQEGWHYEMEDKDSELTLNGVVYNEMKGAFSAPDDVLSREIMNSLFPDTAYGVESGGDPDFIPDLTYENFLKFHGAYYHPVNSYIYLYGNADWNERLEWLDGEYLGRYERIEISSHPGIQEAFKEHVHIVKHYPISEEEKEEKATYLSYNVVLGSSTDRELYIAFQLIDYALTTEGSRLKKNLVDAGIGTEITSSFENGICQPYYSIVAKNADPSDEDKFVEIIEAEFKRVVREGFDKNALLACLNKKEFKYREADSAHYPKGLLLGLACLDSWLYDDRLPFIHVEELDTFAFLREKIDTDYFEKIVEKYLVNNEHRSVLRLEPEKGMTAKKEAELAEKLAAYRNTLSEEEREKIAADTKSLKEYQATPDTEEALKCLPVLKRSDIRKNVLPLINEWTEVDGIKTLFHEIDTNGILYFSMYFDLKRMPVRLYPYLGLLTNVLKGVDTNAHSYEQLGYEIDKYTGRLLFLTDSLIKGEDSSDYVMSAMVDVRCLRTNAPKAAELIKEVLLGSVIDDPKRVKEIIAEARSSMQGAMSYMGHVVAYSRILDCISESDRLNSMMSGMEFYRLLEDWEENFDERWDEIKNNLKEVLSIAYRKDMLTLDVTGSREELKALDGLIAPIADALPIGEISEERGEIVLKRENLGLSNSAQVQYVCKGGSFKTAGLPYDSRLRILRTILSYDYLWTNVRVKGGAYGCMNSFRRTGESYFVSYRDPNLKETIEIFDSVADYVENFSVDEAGMTKFIIGTMSSLDIPLTPFASAARSRYSELAGISEAKLQKERDLVLEANAEDIRHLAEYVKAVMSDPIICVVGNEGRIKEAEDCFDRIEAMFH